jgi:hexosaminidase
MKIRTLLFIAALFLWGGLKLRAQPVPVIPQPQQVKWDMDVFTLDKEIHIRSFSDYPEIAVILQKNMEEILGFSPGISDTLTSESKSISFIGKDSLDEEAYTLDISSEGIEVAASGPAGWYYGTQSLTQLLRAYTEVQTRDTALELRAMFINDAPRFSWRAFMLDEARYFKGMDQVKMLLDEMAALKMNVFHWHLTDDQGWRIEIKKYPLLTQIGSKRKSTQVGPLKWQSPIQSAEPHEGFYTQEEIREIVAYAQERHITVVPEIEMPGHSSAAIASYSWLGTNKEEIEVPIMFGVGKDVYDVSDSMVYQFLTDVLDEVMDLFPSGVIHIGGDEVKYDHWKASPSVQAYMEAHGLGSPAELQVYFTNSISQYLQRKERRMMGWNEIMGHNLHEYQDSLDTESDQQLARETVIHFWKGDVALATHAASNGYDIVNSLHSETYLDYDYKTIPLERAYNFDPVPADLDPEYHDKVIGTGCQMWGEWIPTNGHMHFQVFPRIAAYAEVGWTHTERKDFRSFTSALQYWKKVWKKKGIYFAPDSVTGTLSLKSE